MKTTKRVLLSVAVLLCLSILFSACAASPMSAAKAEDSKSMSASDMTVMDGAGEIYEPEYEYAEAEEDALAAEAPAPNGVGEELFAKDEIRKIIYTLDLNMTADDPEAAMQAFMDYAESVGGYLSNSYTQNDERGICYINFTLHIPPESLSGLRTAAQDLGKVNSDNLYSDEITDQYWDMQARLTTAQKEEEQYLQLLEQCETVEDILKVRQALADVQQEIERYQGVIKMWDKLVDMSTVNIYIERTPATPVEKEDSLIRIWKLEDVWKSIKNGFINTGRFLVNAFYSIFIFLAYALIPLVIIGVIVLIIILCVKCGKKKKAKKAAAKQAEEENK